MAGKKTKLKSALKHEQLSAFLKQITPEHLSELSHQVWDFWYWSVGDPTEEKILQFRDSLPLLKRLIDFEVVLKRFESLDSFERTSFGVSLSDFFPELGKIYKSVDEAFRDIAPGVYKAECWLRPIAKQAGADAEVEAAIYFASKGQDKILDIDALRDSWHAAICMDIVHGKPVGKVPSDVLERARSRTISLAEAKKLLSFHGSLPRFFGFRDEEEDFIDASLFRAVEWFGITGFEPWLDSVIWSLSSGPTDGINHYRDSFDLFFWCRSDLALSMANRRGLEFWLWSLINGQVENDKPWRIFWSFPNKTPTGDIIHVAGAILFLWHRIKPVNMNDDVLQRATDFLYQTQIRCGAWPRHADSSDPSLATTCFAIHGLAAWRPKGWQKSVERAADWIAAEQDPGGFWTESGGPTIMLTVLALDSLDLAKGMQDVTFKLGSGATEGHPDRALSTAKKKDVEPADTIYNFTSEPWHNPAPPETVSVSFTEAVKSTNPQIAIIVATELELRQVLFVLSPLPRRHKLWKVTHGSETYFLGKFGAFQCVVLLSSMSSQGPTGATLSVEAVIREWDPIAALLVGIAFGASRRKHHPGDVLVAEHVIPYEHQRIGTEPIFRNPIPPSSHSLLNRFRTVLDWKFTRSDGTMCTKHIGPILSGDKLIDNIEFKKMLLDQYPNAIGGEMEGSGFYAAATRTGKHWIIVKGVCDWADGRKNDSFQEMAAASSISLALNVFSDEHALDGVI